MDTKYFVITVIVANLETKGFVHIRILRGGYMLLQLINEIKEKISQLEKEINDPKEKPKCECYDPDFGASTWTQKKGEVVARYYFCGKPNFCPECGRKLI